MSQKLTAFSNRPDAKSSFEGRRLLFDSPNYKPCGKRAGYDPGNRERKWLDQTLQAAFLKPRPCSPHCLLSESCLYEQAGVFGYVVQGGNGEESDFQSYSLDLSSNSPQWDEG
jgi:hypothetical protein